MSGALVAMSGGVDSSVAALLVKQQGLDCVGSMMKFFRNEDIGESREKSCCSLRDAEDARAVAAKMDIPFYVMNFIEPFQQQVIDRFVAAYRQGETPNPCIDCNRFLKFDRFLQRARELDLEYVVTGHYARVERDAESGRYLLKKGVDASKDQSYVLYAMTQEQLKHTLFPLGEYDKSKVREIALQHGFINAKKHDSQDICFVQKGGYADFIEQYTGEKQKKGRFIGTDGGDLGEHKGIIHYTIGQRKGLGLSAKTPLYVCGISAEDNRVVVGGEESLYTKTLTAKDINLIPYDRLTGPIKVTAKLRYKHAEQPATVWQTGEDRLQIEFEQPQRAATNGQAVVLYDGDVVVGGGTIHN